ASSRQQIWCAPWRTGRPMVRTPLPMVDNYGATVDTQRPMVDMVDYDQALPVFDVADYVAEFAESVMPAYRSGAADRGYAADNGLARSIIPPGTAATRDFSTLAPRIPKLLAEACDGCIACVHSGPH